MAYEASNLALWAAITFFTPLIVALVPFLRREVSERVLHLMLGFSAGLLGGVTFVNIFPEAIEVSRQLGGPSLYVSFGSALGFFVLLMIERYLLVADEAHGGHFHIHSEPVLDPRHGIIGMSALTVHGFMDGFVIPISFSAGAEVGIVVTLALALHQIPDSFAALSLALSTTNDLQKRLLYVLITALDTPLGIGVGLLLVNLSPVIIPLGLGFTAGTFIYVSASDLVPELQHKARSPMVIVSMSLGFLLVAGITLLISPT